MASQDGQSSNGNLNKVAAGEGQSDKKTSPQGPKRVYAHISNLESIKN